MTTPNAFIRGLALAIGAYAVSAANAEPAATVHHGDVVAFCKAHADVDFPGRLFFGSRYTDGAAPKQLSKLDGVVQWRGMDAHVWVYGDSADGDWCSKKDASRTPSEILKEACHDDPESTSLNFAETHYSAFDWRCKGGKPVIVQSYPLDRRGVFKASWTPAVIKGVVVIGPTELPTGPR